MFYNWTAHIYEKREGGPFGGVNFPEALGSHHHFDSIESSFELTNDDRNSYSRLVEQVYSEIIPLLKNWFAKERPEENKLGKTFGYYYYARIIAICKEEEVEGSDGIYSLHSRKHYVWYVCRNVDGQLNSAEDIPFVVTLYNSWYE
jgi:hypothetical protein